MYRRLGLSGSPGPAAREASAGEREALCFQLGEREAWLQRERAEARQLRECLALAEDNGATQARLSLEDKSPI